MFSIKLLIQNCLHFIKKLIFYILQLELIKLVKNCGFSPQISKDTVLNKNCKNDTNTLLYPWLYKTFVNLSKMHLYYIIKDYSLQKVQFAFEASQMLCTIEHFCQEQKSKFLQCL